MQLNSLINDAHYLKRLGKKAFLRFSTSWAEKRAFHKGSPTKFSTLLGTGLARYHAHFPRIGARELYYSLTSFIILVIAKEDL